MSDPYKKFMQDGKTLRCQEKIWRVMGRWGNFGQCERSAKISDRCRQHDPAVIAGRKRKATEKAEAAWQRRRLEIHGKHFYRALQQIADGHDSPCQLATDIIEKFDKK